MQLVAGVLLIQLLLLRLAVVGPVDNKVELGKSLVIVDRRQKAIGRAHRVNYLDLGTENICRSKGLALADDVSSFLLGEMSVRIEEARKTQILRTFRTLVERLLPVYRAARVHCVDMELLPIRQILYRHFDHAILIGRQIRDNRRHLFEEVI